VESSAKIKGKRRPKFQSATATLPIFRLHDTANDSLTAHSLTSAIKAPSKFYPGKRFGLSDTGAVEALSFNHARNFKTRVYQIGDLLSLHEAFERVRTGVDVAGDPSYVVMGTLGRHASPVFAGRTKSAEQPDDARGTKFRPAGLEDCEHQWVVLDMDKIPNIHRINPRRGLHEMESVIAFLVSLLPPELQSSAHSWQISSSCCVRGADGFPLTPDTAPSHLGAHVRFWLDDYLDEKGRRTLIQRIRDYAWAQMTMRGIEIGRSIPGDPATGIYNQAIFTRASFEGGLVDPLPVRSGLSLSGRPTARLSVLDGELPVLAEKPPQLARKPRREPTDEELHEKAANQSRREHSSILNAAHRQKAGRVMTVPTAPATEIANAVYRAPSSVGKKAIILHVSRWNKLSDIILLVRHRMAHDPAYADGLPIGTRRLTMKCLAALLSHFVPASRLEDTVHAYAVEFCGGEWTRAEWDRPRRIAEYLRSSVLAEASEAEGLDGTSIRETPYLVRLDDLLKVAREEQVNLKLRALRTDAVRKKLERKARGGQFREELNAKISETSAEANKPWESIGISRRTYYNRQATIKKTAEAAQVATPDIETSPPVAPAPVSRPSLGRLFPGLMVSPQATTLDYDPETGEILGALARAA
jgi:hypothetical protein